MLVQKYKAAFDEVKAILKLGSANKPKSDPRAHVGVYITRLIVDYYIIASKIYKASNIDKLPQKIKFIADKIPAALLAEVAASGNCEEHLAVSLYHLLKCGFSQIEVFCAIDTSVQVHKEASDSHVFVVAERDRTANRLHPHSWHKGVLFDPYENILLSTDMKKFPKTLEELTSVCRPAVQVICTIDEPLSTQDWETLHGTLGVFRKYLATIDIETMVRADLGSNAASIGSLGISDYSNLHKKLLKRIDNELKVMKQLISKTTDSDEKQHEDPKDPLKYEFSNKTNVDSSITLNILNSSKVLFFQGLRDYEYNVDAVSEIATQQQLKAAILLLVQLKSGRFFLQDEKCFFILMGINQTSDKSTTSLPERIANISQIMPNQF